MIIIDAVALNTGWSESHKRVTILFFYINLCYVFVSLLQKMSNFASFAESVKYHHNYCLSYYIYICYLNDL